MDAEPIPVAPRIVLSQYLVRGRRLNTEDSWGRRSSSAVVVLLEILLAVTIQYPTDAMGLGDVA